jgi:hypothetical protein
MGIIFLLIMGGVCALIASNKGRSGVGWFFAGFFLHVIALVIICCLSNLKEEQVYRQRVADENRRLREQLRQEKIKSETFRDYTSQRLDAHDQHLGLDTRTLGGAGQAAPAIAGDSAADGSGPVPLAPVDAPAARWYYEIKGETFGPTTETNIRSMLSGGRLAASSLVWADHLSAWQMAGSTPEFHTALPL